MANEIPQKSRQLLTPFPQLFDLMKDARNDALHQGAFARHLTRHAIELALILEDALRRSEPALVADYMVRNPLCAELWHPLSFVRQQMLANSYSYLPLRKEEKWYLISDAHLPIYLGSGSRKEKLTLTVENLLSWKELPAIEPVSAESSLTEALSTLEKSQPPVLLVGNLLDSNALLGILTAFDLL
jgi:hypothetical protein